MIISSRTPEGDPNTCPICLKELRIDPSTVPIRDAPCPHCGHLLRFDEPSLFDELVSGSPYPSTFSTSTEKAVYETGTPKLGAFPFELRDPLLQTIASMAMKHRLPDKSELTFIVETAQSWPDVISTLRQIAEFQSMSKTVSPSHLPFRKVVQNFFAKLVGGKTN
jgi:hypothetical protein